MSAEYIVTGGARVGWANASWPFAKLKVSRQTLALSSAIGSYSFAPEQVVALEPYGSIPVIGRGIRIVHSRADCPANIVFWCFGSPNNLIEKIRAVGFAPQASAGSLPVREGVPVRPLAIVAAVVIWNVLFILDNPAPLRGSKEPGPFVLVALGILCGVAWMLPKSEQLQSLVLKPGRSLGEIQAFLWLSRIVSTFLLLVFLAFAVSKWLAG